ncbi:hypothetical protein [Cedecea colo]|uniref:Uncharacterized protein n=1 Tax=Cedecea colo TaxID=2552946 RepID=A0ABX0VNP6_9ENTR|nr:hypothetical protein [Cedecea colo]NIY48702.1 hypothetical protein [Cedecea colo]
MPVLPLRQACLGLFLARGIDRLVASAINKLPAFKTAAAKSVFLDLIDKGIRGVKAAVAGSTFYR